MLWTFYTQSNRPLLVVQCVKLPLRLHRGPQGPTISHIEVQFFSCVDFLEEPDYYVKTDPLGLLNRSGSPKVTALSWLDALPWMAQDGIKQQGSLG